MEGSYKGSADISGPGNPFPQSGSIHVSFTATTYDSETYMNKLNQYDTGPSDGGNFR
jgi:hypothetical protein